MDAHTPLQIIGIGGSIGIGLFLIGASWRALQWWCREYDAEMQKREAQEIPFRQATVEYCMFGCRDSDALNARCAGHTVVIDA